MLFIAFKHVHITIQLQIQQSLQKHKEVVESFVLTYVQMSTMYCSHTVAALHAIDIFT